MGNWRFTLLCIVDSVQSKNSRECYGSNARVLPVFVCGNHHATFSLDGSIFHLTRGDIYWLIAVGVCQGFLAVTLMVLAIKCLKAIEFGTISYVEPLVASIIGFVFYAENLTLIQGVGCVIIFSCGMIQVFTTKKHKTQNVSAKPTASA